MYAFLYKHVLGWLYIFNGNRSAYFKIFFNKIVWLIEKNITNL